MDKIDLSQHLYDYEHHIHRLIGFFIDDDEYKSRIINERKKGANNEMIVVKSPMKLHQSEQNQIAMYYIGELIKFETMKNDTQYTIELTLVVKSHKSQRGGGVFPLPVAPVDCPGSIFNTVRYARRERDHGVVIALYSEPMIDAVKNILMTYRHDVAAVLSEIETAIANHAVNRDYFILLQTLVREIEGVYTADPSNYEWRKRILLHHARHNKYAHNGIGEHELASVWTDAMNPQAQTYINLVYLHSILHSYESLYMTSAQTEGFWSSYMMASMVSHILREKLNDNTVHHLSDLKKQCYINLLTRHSGDFLEKDGDNYIMPYRIRMGDPDVLKGKHRQYLRPLGDPDQPALYGDFIDQLRTEAVPPAVGAPTPYLPNTEVFITNPHLIEEVARAERTGLAFSNGKAGIGPDDIYDMYLHLARYMQAINTPGAVLPVFASYAPAVVGGRRRRTRKVRKVRKVRKTRRTR